MVGPKRFLLCTALLLLGVLAVPAAPPLAADGPDPDGKKAVVSRVNKWRAQELRRQGFNYQRARNYTKAIEKYWASLQYEPHPNIEAHIKRLETLARAAGQRVPGDKDYDPKAYVPKPKKSTPYEVFPGARMHPSTPPMSTALGYPQQAAEPEDNGLPVSPNFLAKPSVTGEGAAGGRATGAEALARIYKYEGLELLKQRRYEEALASLTASLGHKYDPKVEEKIALVRAKIREMGTLAAVQRRRQQQRLSSKMTDAKALEILREQETAQARNALSATQARERLETAGSFVDAQGAHRIEVVDCRLTTRTAAKDSNSATVELFPLQRVDRIEYWPGSPPTMEVILSDRAAKRVILENGVYVSDTSADTARLVTSSDVTWALITLIESCGGQATVRSAAQ